LTPAFEALALALAVAGSSPREDETVVGRDGLQVGWDAWSWDALARSPASARLEGAELVLRSERASVRCRLAPEELLRARSALAAAESVFARSAD
jgi:hypothetical protein